MIWSIIPPEIVFRKDDDCKRNYQEYLGLKVQTVTDEYGREKIAAIISSDPQDYLKKELLPGSLVDPRKKL